MSLCNDELESMDQINNRVDNLMLSDARQVTADGSTARYAGKSLFGKSSEDNGSRADDDNTEENLLSEARQGLNPSTNGESENPSTESESDEESSSEDEEIKAPFELLGEFLQCIRSSDWENAAKLCKMILIYEPENELALRFQPIIEEKAQIEKELAEMSSSSDDEEEYSTEEESSGDETESDEYGSDDNDNDQDEEFIPRPGSTMKNPLIFPHQDPAWKP